MSPGETTRETVSEDVSMPAADPANRLPLPPFTKAVVELKEGMLVCDDRYFSGPEEDGGSNAPSTAHQRYYPERKQ